MRHLLVQKMSINGQEIDLSLLQSITYVETLDLSGPRLIAELKNFDRAMQDDYRAIDGSEVEVTFDDSIHRGGINHTEAFFLRSVTAGANGLTTLEGLASAVNRIKQPEQKALFLNNKTVKQILGVTVGGGETDAFPVIPAFHINPGERISKKLRQLSRECGARVYYLRGKWYFKAIDKLWQQSPFDTFYADDMRKERVINGFENIYQSNLTRDRVTRHYLGWNISDGPLAESKHNTFAPEITQYHQRGQLDGISSHIDPVIKFTSDGDGALVPGQMHRLRFPRNQQGKPFDETVPEFTLATQVAHWYSVQKYHSMITGGVYQA